MHKQSSMIYCECGCREKIHSINKMGKPARFKNHHNSNNPQTHANWKGGRIINSGGYILIHKPDHPFHDNLGYVREHRLIMEEYIGRYLEPSEVVHHINGDKTDNRIENLELTSPSIHKSRHLKEQWKKGVFTHNQYNYYKKKRN